MGIGPDCAPGAFQGQETSAARWEGLHRAYQGFQDADHEGALSFFQRLELERDSCHPVKPGRCGSDRSILTLHATSALPIATGCVGESHCGADLTFLDAPVA